jgi:hypothetical protein
MRLLAAKWRFLPEKPAAEMPCNPCSHDPCPGSRGDSAYKTTAANALFGKIQYKKKGPAGP